MSRKRQDKTSLISEKLEKEKNAKIAALKSKEKRHEEYINAKRQQEKKDAQESKEKIKAKQIEAERRRLEELEKRKERAQVSAGFSCITKNNKSGYESLCSSFTEVQHRQPEIKS